MGAATGVARRTAASKSNGISRAIVSWPFDDSGGEIGQIVEKDAPQPSQQLRLGVSLEAAEIAVAVQEGLLNKIGSSAFGP